MAARNAFGASIFGVLGLALLFGRVPPAAGQPVDPAFIALVERYGRGSHVPAVAELTGWSDEDLDRFAREIEKASRSGRSGRFRGEIAAVPHQLSTIEPEFLRAAVMLLADGDESERVRIKQDREHTRSCTGPKAAIASRYAGVLARAEGEGDRDFARGLFLAMAEISKYDACFTHAERWARDGLKLFPRDARLLTSLGGVIEADATLRPDRTLALPSPNLSQQKVSREEAGNQRSRFNEARQAYEEALAADGEQVVARVRLGRVLWRLGESEEAAAALKRAIDDARSDPRTSFLGHLFLGRVHEDAGRLEEAAGSYRQAVLLAPKSQPAGIALAHVLRLAGDEKAAREVAARTVGFAGQRAGRDFFWEYLNGYVTPEELLADLRAKVR